MPESYTLFLMSGILRDAYMFTCSSQHEINQLICKRTSEPNDFHLDVLSKRGLIVGNTGGTFFVWSHIPTLLHRIASRYLGELPRLSSKLETL